MRLALALALLLVSCAPIDNTADPWVLKEVAPTPLGCKEWRDRDPGADC